MPRFRHRTTTSEEGGNETWGGGRLDALAPGEPVKARQLLGLDWDAVAGIIAAVAAIVLHLLHIIDEGVLITIAVVLIALLFIRDLRRERATERAYAGVDRSLAILQTLEANLAPADAVLVGPSRLRPVSEQFSAQSSGEMLWFNVCLSMFRPQSLFDTLLRPAIENPRVTSIQFILDPRQQALWTSEVLPKANACRGREKLRPPRWTAIEESVSLIIADAGSSGKTECLLSFWGEPFMAHTVERKVPRYIFHVQGHSELVARLVELARNYRFTGAASSSIETNPLSGP